jgi:hypothetical protein
MTTRPAASHATQLMALTRSSYPARPSTATMLSVAR